MRCVVVLFVALLTLNLGVARASHWTPPIGIPAPSFGIEESTNDTTFTHWVDNSRKCSDSGNGTPASPRCTIPTTLAAGSIVQVRGGPYILTTDQVWTANGTPSQPVYVRGPSSGPRPVYRITTTSTRRLIPQGSYFIIENLEFDQTRLVQGVLGRPADHIVIRHNEIHHNPARTGTALAGTGAVFWNNHTHHHQADGAHGVTVAEGASQVWIVDNDIHHNGDDGIQFCHLCSANPPTNVYVGRNVIHSDRENAIDLKWGTNVVLSQNTVYGYRSAAKGEFCFDDGSGCFTYSSGSDGSAILIGADGGPTNAWVIFNTIYNSQNGIRHESSCVGPICESGAGPAYTIGNVIYDIIGDAFVVETSKGMWHAAYNTADDVGGNGVKGTAGIKEVHFENNIFSNVAVRPIDIGNVHANSTAPNNLIWPGPVTLRWGRAVTYNSTSDLAAFPGGLNNRIADPYYVNARERDYHLRTGSSAIDAATPSLEAYNALFQAAFGVGASILKDHDGGSRLRQYDIGAFEWGSSVVPNAPSNLILR